MSHHPLVEQHYVQVRVEDKSLAKLIKFSSHYKSFLANLSQSRIYGPFSFDYQGSQLELDEQSWDAFCLLKRAGMSTLFAKGMRSMEEPRQEAPRSDGLGAALICSAIQPRLARQEIGGSTVWLLGAKQFSPGLINCIHAQLAMGSEFAPGTPSNLALRDMRGRVVVMPIRHMPQWQKAVCRCAGQPVLGRLTLEGEHSLAVRAACCRVKGAKGVVFYNDEEASQSNFIATVLSCLKAQPLHRELDIPVGFSSAALQPHFAHQACNGYWKQTLAFTEPKSPPATPASSDVAPSSSTSQAQEESSDDNSADEDADTHVGDSETSTSGGTEPSSKVPKVPGRPRRSREQLRLTAELFGFEVAGQISFTKYAKRWRPMIPVVCRKCKKEMSLRSKQQAERHYNSCAAKKMLTKSRGDKRQQTLEGALGIMRRHRGGVRITFSEVVSFFGEAEDLPAAQEADQLTDDDIFRRTSKDEQQAYILSIELHFAVQAGIISLRTPLLQALAQTLRRRVWGETTRHADCPQALALAEDVALTAPTSLLSRLYRENLLIAPARTLRKRFLPPQSYDGTNSEVVLRFFELAAVACKETCSISGGCYTLPVTLAIDGLALSSALDYDMYTDTLCGILPRVSPKQLEPLLGNYRKLYDWMASSSAVTSVDLHVVTTLDGKMSLPIATYYRTSQKAQGIVDTQVQSTVEELGTCVACRRDSLACIRSDKCTPCERCHASNQTCIFAEVVLVSMDAEPSQLSWMRNTSRLAVPDLPHFAKNLRNSFLNYFLLVEDHLINTRQLLMLVEQDVLDIPPTTCFPSDRMAHRHLEALFDAIDDIPDTWTQVQVHPDSLLYSRDNTVRSPFTNIQSITPGLGRDIIIERKASVVQIVGRLTGKLTTVHARDPLDSAFADSMSHAVLLCRKKVYLMEVTTGCLAPVTVSNRAHIQATMISFAPESKHGFVGGSTCVARCIFAGATLTISTTTRIAGKVTAIACADEGRCFTATALKVLELSGRGCTRIFDRGASGLAITPSGLCILASDGVHRFDAHSTKRLFSSTYGARASLAAFKETLFVADRHRVFLCSETRPIRNYLTLVRTVFLACGLSSDKRLADMVAELGPCIDALQTIYDEQTTAAVGYRARRGLQGTASFMSNNTKHILDLLQTNLPELKQLGRRNPVFRAKAATEVTVETMFSLICQGHPLALSHHDFAMAMPKVCQRLLLRYASGLPLPRDCTNPAYPSVSIGPSHRCTITISFPEKPPLPDRTESQRLVQRLRRTIGARAKVGRVRAQRLAPLGTRHTALYLRLKQAVPADTPSQTTPTDTDELFEANEFVGVRGAGDEIWIGKLGSSVLMTDKTADITWLEQIGESWEFGHCQQVRVETIIASASQYVKVDPLSVASHCFTFLKQAMDELLEHQTEKQTVVERLYAKSYRTTSKQRASRRRRMDSTQQPPQDPK